jgi:CRISPR-associated protein Cmr2
MPRRGPLPARHFCKSREQLQFSTNDLRFPDTWTMAAAKWLNDAGIAWRHNNGSVPWNGHWLHWSRADENLDDANCCPEELWQQIQKAKESKAHGKPPVYYAILKLDGDNLGGWLRGEKSPKVHKVMHPQLVKYYEGLGQATRAGLDAQQLGASPYRERLPSTDCRVIIYRKLFRK